MSFTGGQPGECPPEGRRRMRSGRPFSAPAGVRGARRPSGRSFRGRCRPSSTPGPRARRCGPRGCCSSRESRVHTSSAQALHDSVSFAPGLQTACEQVPPPPPPLLEPLLDPEPLPRAAARAGAAAAAGAAARSGAAAAARAAAGSGAAAAARPAARPGAAAAARAAARSRAAAARAARERRAVGRAPPGGAVVAGAGRTEGLRPQLPLLPEVTS